MSDFYMTIKDKRYLLSDAYHDKPFFTSRDQTLAEIQPKQQFREYPLPKQNVKLTIPYDLIDKTLKQSLHNYTVPQKTVMGMDTETIHGVAKLLCISTGEYCFISSFTDFLEFCLINQLDTYLNFFYHLKYDVQAIMSHLDDTVLADIHFNNTVELDYMTITYIPRKFLRIKYMGKTFRFYDIMPFYLTSLNKASKYYFGEEKLDIDIEKLEDKQFWKDNEQLIIDYCTQDAYLCQQLAVMSQNQYNELGLNFNRPISTASMSEQFAIRYSSVPKYYSNFINSYGWFSYFGGRFEQFQKGYFEQIYKYDINSAYPYVMSKLPDLSNGSWSFDIADLNDCEFGFVFGIMSTKDQYVQPIAVSDTQSLKYPFVNKHYRYLTLNEYRYFMTMNMMNFKILHVALFFPNDNAKPFSYLQNMYNKRLEYKDTGDPRQLPLKILMNATYGKFIQVIINTKDKLEYVTGNLFNPLYASYTTADCRLELLKFIHKHDIQPIAFYTDCVLTDQKLYYNSKRLGAWDLETQGELLAIGCGVYSVRDGNKAKTHLRGFSNSNNKSLFDIVEEQSSYSHLKINLRRPLGLGEIVQHIHKRSNNHLNEWISEPKEIQLNFDQKRIWDISIDRAEQLLTNNYDSKALLVRR